MADQLVDGSGSDCIVVVAAAAAVDAVAATFCLCTPSCASAPQVLLLQN